MPFRLTTAGPKDAELTQKGSPIDARENPPYAPLRTHVGARRVTKPIGFPIKRLFLAALPCLLVAGSPASLDQAGEPSRSAAPALAYTVVLNKLDGPWDMAFLPDGTMFFTEKCLGLSVRLPNGTVVKLLGMKDSKGYAATANDLFCEGKAGMQGVAVDPDFARNRFLYVCPTSSLTAPGTNRVLRLKVNADVTAVSGRVDTVTDIPYKDTANDLPFGGPGAHNGVPSASAPVKGTCM